MSDARLHAASYSALRYGGAPPARAAAELRLSPVEAEAAERVFHASLNPPGKGERMLPRHRHDAHLTAVCRERGGFPA